MVGKLPWYLLKALLWYNWCVTYTWWVTDWYILNRYVVMKSITLKNLLLLMYNPCFLLLLSSFQASSYACEQNSWTWTIPCGIVKSEAFLPHIVSPLLSSHLSSTSASHSDDHKIYPWQCGKSVTFWITWLSCFTVAATSLFIHLLPRPTPVTPLKLAALNTIFPWSSYAASQWPDIKPCNMIFQKFSIF